ncbi:hypothetical protein [Shewanella algae]|jgi:hypothetical protein|nr:hypothetical protein [Shewanella algae]TVO81456.1 hypothetical protein AYI80_21255 [Shewanella algae]TXS81991.1 hypothetical protein AYI81_21190 [Shewanella algae]
MANLSINTRQLAELLRIKEGELVHELKSTGKFCGVPFPPVISTHRAQGRKFKLDAALEFAKKVSVNQYLSKKEKAN